MSTERNLSDRLLTYDEAAEYLGLSAHTLRRRVVLNRIPFIRLGPKITRFRRSELDAWIDQHRNAPSFRKKAG